MYLCELFKMRVGLTILLIIVLSACNSEYTNALKTEDIEVKYEAAKKYYNEAKQHDSIARVRANSAELKDTVVEQKVSRKERRAQSGYSKALPLFDGLISEMRLTGDRRLEEVYFYYAYCWAGSGDYSMAAFHFKIFIETYTRSSRREQAWYQYVYCKYALTYPVELDQTATKNAIKEIQLFVNQYPNSVYINDCNVYLDKLRDKLKEKAYRQAKLYYQIGDYKAALTTMRSVINDYPEIEQKEELSYLIVKSHYMYADKSITSKQEERYEETIEEINMFKSEFPNSTYLPELETLKIQTNMAIKEVKAEMEKEKAKKAEKTPEPKIENNTGADQDSATQKKVE